MKNEIEQTTSEKIDYLNKVTEKSSANMRKLRQVSADTSAVIIAKMRQLEIEIIELSHTENYFINEISSNSGFTATHLFYETVDDQNAVDVIETYNLANDYFARVSRSSKETLFNFARNIDKIIAKLTEIAENQIAKSEEGIILLQNKKN